jgi:ATP-binding cassette, subfamily B, bacterial
LPARTSPVSSVTGKGLRTTIVRGIRMAWEASPTTFVAIAVSAAVTALIPTAVLALTRRLFDTVQHSVIDPSVTLGNAMPIVIGLGLLAGSQRMFTQFDGRRQTLFAERVTIDVQRRFLEQISRADLGYFDDPAWHDRVERASRDVYRRPFTMTYTLIGLGSSMVTMVGMVGLLVSLDWRLLPLAVGSIAPGTTLSRRLNKRRYTYRREKTQATREKEYLAELLSKPQTSKEIRALGIGTHLTTRWETLARELYAGMVEVFRSINRYTILIGLLSGGALAIAFAIVTSRAIGSSTQFGALAVVTGAFVSVTAQANAIASAFVTLDENGQFLADYFSFFETESLIEVPDDPTPIPALTERGIEFDDVWLTYPNGTEPALSGVTLTIKPGELCALVGDNGAGKSTIVKSLLRFYDPQVGSVKLGGVDLRATDPAALRSRIGVLFQDFAQYELSVRENVTLGRPERPATDMEVVEALRSARAEWLVERMPGGLDSKVGRLFDGGHDLSGGEWQRLALARLMFRDADVWVLDEPTSSLDPEAEAAIFAELRANLHGRIGIVISHRFSTVRIADRIAVVQGGRITEHGTHEELLAHNGRYAYLFNLQAAGYR